MMGRIINLEGFLSNLDTEVVESEKITLDVIDNQIEENNGCFEIYIKDNKVNIEKTNKKPQLTLSINSLSQLAFSYLNLEEVIFLNNLEVEDICKDVLNNIFIKRDNYINEYV
jgi:predicted acetyltransferase